MMNWDTLLTSALLGLERRPLQTPPFTENSENAEHTFLLNAAVLGLQRRAGYEPTVINASLPAEAPPETRPVVSLRAQRQLHELLYHRKRTELLLEWLAGHARKGRRIPHPYLPALLDMTSKDSPLSVWVAASYGARGRWLAMNNPKWRHPLAFNEAAIHTLLHTPPRPPDPKALQKALLHDEVTDANSVITAVSKHGPVSTPALVNLVIDRIFQFTGRNVGVWRLQPLQTIAVHFTPDMLPHAINRLHQEQMNGIQELHQIIDGYQFRREILEEIERDERTTTVC